MTQFRLLHAVRKYPFKERPPMPGWLKNKPDHYYWKKIYYATPFWLSQKQIKQMRTIYESSKIDEQVDHIVPLKSNLVCGLHVPWNLRVLQTDANQHKSNHTWPGMPFSNRDLFDDVPL